MRRLLPALPVLLLGLGMAGPALAQAAGGTGVDVSWSALDPRDDWAATIIRAVFPVYGPSGSEGTGNAATVIGEIVRYLTGFVMAITCFFVAYTLLMQMVRGAETAKIFGSGMTSLVPVRIGVAAIFMFPLASGFSTGQAAVVQVSMWGIGMARMVYERAVTAIGADARVIADPVIPGTRAIVAGLIRNEVCRALVNTVANNPNLVPAPAPVSARAGSDTVLTWTYRLAAGNETGAPVCGAVTLRISGGQDTVAGVAINQSGAQRDILTSILSGTIRPAAQRVAQQVYSNRRASDLEPLTNVMVQATAEYTNRLTSAASDAMSRLRGSLTNARNGAPDAATTRLLALGWSSAGAYYLEFSRLNGATLSLMSSVPSVTRPSAMGLGPSLTNDLSPLMESVDAYMERLEAYVATADQASMPTGGNTLFAGASAAEDGAGLLERLLRTMNLGEAFLVRTASYLMAPGISVWTDPFGNLMQLGHYMISAALAAIGAASIGIGASAGAATATGSNFITGLFVSWAPAAMAKSLEFLSPMIYALAAGLLIPGLTIAFVLPMIPWLIWIAGVGGWLILVCEAVIAVPLWMLAHMTARGEGLHGRAVEGYSLLFNILFRPVLMLLGLFLAYFIFASMSWLLRQSFGIAAGFVIGNGWVVTNMLGMIVLLSICVFAHVILALTSFRMISLVPHHLPRMIGFLPANRVDMDGFAREVGMAGTAGALKKVEDAVSPKRIAAGTGSGTRGERTDPESPRARHDGMDSTMRASTDMSTPRRHDDDEG
ncbi:DotA/TraY family protein [Plastoroseomonas hellenica]|uniref:DotA/TraY family protein n=1 Tax=Plastoroseomonas hellenica TaxID=2687306 RepID=UPI001BAC5AE6|nr:DotA/TraY family protein [Plastoroseomonas hellenica]MBR0646893.1 DotA/TraY family protein [Plastoroseomonas hellenica]